MRFELFIAFRYLIAKKSQNIINIISGISVAGVMTGTMALVVVLSVFNGFQDLVSSLFNVFDPDLKISLVEGKTFSENEIPFGKISEIDGVASYTKVLEENALVRYNDRQFLATLRGVDSGYLKHSMLDSLITDGEPVLEQDTFDLAIVGYGIAYFLGIMVDDPDNILTVFVPDKSSNPSALDPESFFSSTIRPSAIFSVQQDFDNKYIFTPLRYTRNLLNEKDRLTSVEIRLTKGINAEKVKKQIRIMAGERFKVENRYEQETLLYKTMKSEKWAIFFILSFILIVATFNMLGSVTMLILEKKKDINILQSMGASRAVIRKIFLLEGIMINLAGAVGGIILGIIICWLQLKFGFVKLNDGSGTFIVKSYPVIIKAADLLLIFLTVMGVGIIAAWLPVRLTDKKLLQN